MKRGLRNHYQVLGLDRHATDAQVRDAYRALAKRHHPDVSGTGSNDAVFKAVALAYEVLSDPKSRAKYDAQLDVDDCASATAPPGRAHYSWENIAARKPGRRPNAGVNQNERDPVRAPGPSEFDEMYDTFFGPGTKGV